jgi:hypothetical protein
MNAARLEKYLASAFWFEARKTFAKACVAQSLKASMTVHKVKPDRYFRHVAWEEKFRRAACVKHLVGPSSALSFMNRLDIQENHSLRAHLCKRCSRFLQDPSIR